MKIHGFTSLSDEQISKMKSKLEREDSKKKSETTIDNELKDKVENIIDEVLKNNQILNATFEYCLSTDNECKWKIFYNQNNDIKFLTQTFENFDQIYYLKSYYDKWKAPSDSSLQKKNCQIL